ncbi:hypothetical protein BDN72DRAFT_759302 [Pluteus cervinus]|uniref:Uncharacterized protein n=1 Tax=Pluteus cervinus TaxID=181527 RepID=A0ACD3B9W0_9AGAR|nr:hypothetical protein BDN72DRAFT_759302 [Pluteus cervinus]
MFTTLVDGSNFILISGDPNPQEFFVLKDLLAMASPFFKDMLTLPQSLNDTRDIPTITVTETGNCIELLLQFVYPTPEPRVDTLDDLVPVLRAAIKYDLTIAVERLRRRLVSFDFLRTSPIRVYGIASQLELTEEANMAAQHVLRENALKSAKADDLHHVSAYWYHQLLTLKQRRIDEARKMLVPPENLKCMQCNSFGHGASGLPNWWHDFVKRAQAELAERPMTDTIFSMQFIAQSATSGCPRCPLSLLEAVSSLTRLKSDMDTALDAVQ